MLQSRLSILFFIFTIGVHELRFFPNTEEVLETRTGLLGPIKVLDLLSICNECIDLLLLLCVPLLSDDLVSSHVVHQLIVYLISEGPKHTCDTDAIEEDA